MAKTGPASEKPKRYRVARSDASIESILKKTERDYGLPEGSVKLIYPSGRKARSDAAVGTLLKQWNG